MEDNADLFAAFGQPEETPRTASPSAASAAGPSDHDDLHAAFAEGSKQLEPTASSVAMSPVTGFNKAIISLGTPVDLVHSGLKKAVYEPLGIEASDEPFLGTASIRKGLSKIGVEPEAERYKPRSRTEEILQAGGEGVGQALTLAAAAPALTSRLATVAPRTAEIIDALFAARPAVGTSRAAAAAPIAELGIPAFAGGVGAEVAQGLVPETWKPLAGMGGGLAGGAIGALGVAGSKAIPAMARGIEDYLAPLTAKGQERVAAEKLAKGLDNPNGIIDTIENEPREIVKGSKPTLFELTGEGGQMQRRAETLRPDEFNARRGEQASARLDELGNIIPETEAVELPKFLRGQMDEIDRLADSATAWAEQKARQEVEKLGGTGNPEDYGALLRGYLQAAQDTVRKARQALYDAIDPDGTINVVASNLRDKAAAFMDNMGPYETPLTGEAKRLFEQAGGMPDVVSFRDIIDFDKAVTGAMSAENRANGRSPLWGQLSQLKGFVKDAIENSLENQAAYEAKAAASGEKGADSSLFARIQQWVDDFKGGKATTEKELAPNLGEEEAARLKAAKDKHTEYATVFKQGPVGNVLKTAGYTGQFMTPNATVVGKFFPAGNGGFEAATAFRKAVGDDAKATAVMTDYISWSLRNAAERPDGTLDPKKFAAWRDRHESALRAFPELEGKFTDAVKSSQLIDELAVSRAAAVKDYQQGFLKKLIGMDENADVADVIGGVFGRKDSVQLMKKLAEMTGDNPDARNALKRSIADYINKKFITTTEAGVSEANTIRSAQFQKFVRDNRDTLAAVFDKKELGSMQAIADDLHRSNRSVSGNALPGRSTTAQDLLPDLARQKDTNLGPFGKTVLSAEAGSQIGGIKGMLLGVGSAVSNNVLSSMRRAGMERVEDLMVEALLNPDVAAAMLKSVKPREGFGAGDTLAAAIRRLPAIGFAGSIEGEPQSGPMEITVRPKPQKFAGGRIGRKAGGRIPTDTGIDTDADALLRAAESTKKALGKETEVLLNQDDNTIAHALEVANKAI